MMKGLRLPLAIRMKAGEMTMTTLAATAATAEKSPAQGVQDPAIMLDTVVAKEMQLTEAMEILINNPRTGPRVLPMTQVLEAQQGASSGRSTSIPETRTLRLATLHPDCRCHNFQPPLICLYYADNAQQ